MLLYKQIVIAVSLYQGVVRRNREEYLLHPLRMSEKAKECGFGNRIQLLCLLHDVLEVNDKVTITDLQELYHLEPVDLEVLHNLTRYPEESSEQHFERVLNARSIYTLLVKYFDCLDNASFTEEDNLFYLTCMDESVEQAKAKYQKRLKRIEAKLAEYGHPIPVTV